MRVGIGVFLVAVMAAGPVLAEWRFRSSGTTAGVWVRNDDGTSLALNCEGNGEGRLRMDLTVTPTPDAPGGPGVATLSVGGFSTQVPTEPYGPEGQRLQILRIDVDYAAEEIAELRGAMRRGNVLRLPAQPGFQAVDFSLRGSGAAIGQLEEACPNVWEIARNVRGG